MRLRCPQWLVILVVLTGWMAMPSAALGDDVPQQESSQMEGLSDGDTPRQQAFDQALLDGRDAYNDGDWQQAVDHFTRAVQLGPDRAAAYRNLARSYNMKGQLDRATAYYDYYLELAGDAEDAETIREERRGTIARGGDDPWTVPADQRMARRALQRELDAGRAVTDAGGGAWGMYQTLLDLGYARPDLQRLSERLVTRLVDEIDETFEPEDGFVPLLSEERFRAQQTRLEALRKLAADDAKLERADGAEKLLDVIEALADAEFETAVELVEQLQQFDHFGFAVWYRVVALEGSGEYADALEVLDELLEAELFDGEGQRRAELMRAKLLQQLGETDEATEIFKGLLAR